MREHTFSSIKHVAKNYPLGLGASRVCLGEGFEWPFYLLFFNHNLTFLAMASLPVFIIILHFLQCNHCLLIIIWQLLRHLLAILCLRKSGQPQNGCFCYPNTFLFFEKQSTIEHMTWQLLGGQDLESWLNKFSFYKRVIDKSFATSATTTTTTTTTPSATPAKATTCVQFSNLHSLSNSFFLLKDLILKIGN